MDTHSAGHLSLNGLGIHYGALVGPGQWGHEDNVNALEGWLPCARGTPRAFSGGPCRKGQAGARAPGRAPPSTQGAALGLSLPFCKTGVRIGPTRG